MARRGCRLPPPGAALGRVLLAALLLGPTARAAAPSYCARTGTPLPAPVVEAGSFGFSVSADEKGSTIAVGQPDATNQAGIVYNYNQVRLCGYRSYELPAPPPPPAPGAAPPGLLGMMTALSRDGRVMAVAGGLEAGGLTPQLYIYTRQSNDSTGGFELAQRLAAAPALANASRGEGAGRVYAGSLSVSRDGRIVLASWSVYGAGRSAESPDPYGPPAATPVGAAQLFRRGATGRWARGQDLVLAAPPLGRTQVSAW